MAVKLSSFSVKSLCLCTVQSKIDGSSATQCGLLRSQRNNDHSLAEVGVSQKDQEPEGNISAKEAI